MLANCLERYVLLGAAERDAKFRQEVLRASYVGLRTLSLVEMFVPMLLYVARTMVMGGRVYDRLQAAQTAAVVITGAVTFAVRHAGVARTHARGLAIASSLISAAGLICAPLLLGGSTSASQDFLESAVTVVILTAVASLPLQPLQTLTLGLAAELVFIYSAAFSGDSSVSGATHILLILVVTLLASGLSSVLYSQRVESFREHQRAVEIAEALAAAQLRAQLAESSVAIGKMAAAIVHEINSPLGALKSAVDTLSVVSERLPSAAPDQQRKLAETQSQLWGSLQDSAQRISRVIARLQRFVSLYEAEPQQANVNNLISSVLTTFEGEVSEDLAFEVDLQPVPELTCRPELLSAVFANLVSNAINAVDGNGRVRVSTRVNDRSIEIAFSDNGRGMPSDVLENVFDPGFTVSETRVSTGNWSLFNSRQVLYQHGGDIDIESVEGQGTTVTVSLPLPPASAT